MTTCTRCLGEMRQTKATLPAPELGEGRVIHHVPAWICTECEEVVILGEDFLAAERAALGEGGEK